MTRCRGDLANRPSALNRQVLEPRFNVEALALLLNIPPSKTLLRRHLATHFHLLVGAEAQREKQECLENPDYSVLTATARVKVRTVRPLQAAHVIFQSTV